jgi:hypothetical protein
VGGTAPEFAQVRLPQIPCKSCYNRFAYVRTGRRPDSPPPYPRRKIAEAEKRHTTALTEADRTQDRRLPSGFELSGNLCSRS